MMFRKLYWVTELVSADGTSRVAGVYTSIPDLIRSGLRYEADVRLTLTKLDCTSDPLGVWTGPDYRGLEAGLEEFIQTDEFSREHCLSLAHALRKSVAA